MFLAYYGLACTFQFIIIHSLHTVVDFEPNTCWFLSRTLARNMSLVGTHMQTCGSSTNTYSKSSIQIKLSFLIRDYAITVLLSTDCNQ